MKLLRAVVVLGALAGSAVALTVAGWRALGSAWAQVLAPGPASLDQLAGAVAGTALAVTAGWLATCLVAAGTAALCERAGRAGGRLAAVSRQAAPAALHRLVGVLLGTGLVLGVAAPALAAPALSSPTGPARAGTAATATAATAGRAAGDLDPTWSAGPARVLGSPVRAAAVTEVVVRRGDTLWDLAARRLGPAATGAEIAAEWPRWYAANRALIGPDPDRLEPGQRLRVPGHGHGPVDR